MSGLCVSRHNINLFWQIGLQKMAQCCKCNSRRYVYIGIGCTVFGLILLGLAAYLPSTIQQMLGESESVTLLHSFQLMCTASCKQTTVSETESR